MRDYAIIHCRLSKTAWNNKTNVQRHLHVGVCVCTCTYIFMPCRQEQERNFGFATSKELWIHLNWLRALGAQWIQKQRLTDHAVWVFQSRQLQKYSLYLPKINGIKLWQGIFTHQENLLWLRRMAKHWNKLPGTVVQSQASEEAGPKPVRDGRRGACWARKWNKFLDLAAKCMNP